MRNYMKRAWDTRRSEAIIHLGGKCAMCGCTERLEFDHIDPETKSFTIADFPTKAIKKFWEEIAKCQLLCYNCHKLKSRKDGAHGNTVRQTICTCGRLFETTRQYAGHKRWCT